MGAWRFIHNICNSHLIASTYAHINKFGFSPNMVAVHIRPCTVPPRPSNTLNILRVSRLKVARKKNSWIFVYFRKDISTIVDQTDAESTKNDVQLVIVLWRITSHKEYPKCCSFRRLHSYGVRRLASYSQLWLVIFSCPSSFYRFFIRIASHVGVYLCGAAFSWAFSLHSWTELNCGQSITCTVYFGWARRKKTKPMIWTQLSIDRMYVKWLFCPVS